MIKRMLKIFILLTLFSTRAYSKNTIDIRGYQFGESFVSVLNLETQKKELELITHLTNKNRLVYRGYLLNKPVQLFFHFRNQRLSEISYSWSNLSNEVLFYQNIQYLLNSKYSLQQQKSIQAKNSKIDYTSYLMVQTNAKDIPTPVLQLTLENIIQTNDMHHIILEFQAYDSDMVIQKKILSEDI